MIFGVVSKVIGFGREITLAYFFGASSVSDAYLISLTIPMVIFSFVGVAVKTTYIPLFSEIINNDGVSAGNSFTDNVICCLMAICTLIVLVVLGFTTQIVKLFASGFAGDTLLIAVQLTKFTIVAIYFTGINYIYEAFLQVNRNFIVPGLIGIPLNIIVIISIVLASKGNFKLLAVGQVAAVFSQMLLLSIFMYKNGYRFKLAINIKDKYILKMMVLSLPVMIGTSDNQINKLVDRTLASNILEGGISALVYANKLNLFIHGTFSLAIATVLFPQISKMASDNNIEGLKSNLSKSIIGIIVLVLPVTVGTVIFSTPIVDLLFGRGAFGTDAVVLTANVLVFYSIGMVGYGMREVLSGAFYSMQDTKTPMINAVIGMVLNVILNVILSKYLGICGLALATSISALVTTGLLFIGLRRKIGLFGDNQFAKSVVKISTASICMGLIAKFGNDYLLFISGNSSLALFLSVVLGAFSYFIMVSFMGIDEVEEVVVAVKRKIVDRF